MAADALLLQGSFETRFEHGLHRNSHSHSGVPLLEFRNSCGHPPPFVHLKDNLSDDSQGYCLVQYAHGSKLWTIKSLLVLPVKSNNGKYTWKQSIFSTCFLNNFLKVSAREGLGGSLNPLILGFWTWVYKQHLQPSLMGGRGASMKAGGAGWWWLRR